MQQHESLHEPDAVINLGLDPPARGTVEASRGDRLEDARARDRLWRKQQRTRLEKRIRRTTRIYMPSISILVYGLVSMGFRWFDLDVLGGYGFPFTLANPVRDATDFTRSVLLLGGYILVAGLGNWIVLELVLHWSGRLERELAEYEDPEEAAES